MSTTLAAPTLANCEVASFRHTGPHRLSLRFLDGLVADLDFADYGKTGGPLKRALNDPSPFARAYLDHGILTWPHGYDIAPETLRRYAEDGCIDM
jgi:Protein of unknown function (DUF2442)